MDYEHTHKAVQALYNYENIKELDEAFRVLNLFYRQYRSRLQDLERIDDIRERFLEK